MSTAATPTPATATLPAPLPTAQQAQLTALLSKVMPALSTENQAIVALASALQMPQADALMKTVASINNLTAVAMQVPNPTVEVGATVAALLEQIIEPQLAALSEATKPAEIVANAKPSFFLKVFHPHIAKQEEDLAAQQAKNPVTPASAAASIAPAVSAAKS